MRALLRHPAVLRGAGRGLAAYLKLVRATSRLTVEPADAYAPIDADYPVVFALWHGQHLMIPFGRRPHDRFSVLISRHGDGAINAAACEAFGIRPIRGSGAQRPDQVVKRGGGPALRAMMGALKGGECVTLTADVPKVARVAGRGVVALARASGRPVVPVALAASRRIDLASWDRASLGLPFARLALVVGAPLRVARDADAGAQEAARRAIEAALDDVNARAYARVGARDPGAGRPEVGAARERARRAAESVPAGAAPEAA